MPQPSSVTSMPSMPPAVEGHGDARGACVERVLHQLLHRSRRALDDLAGGDAVDGMRWKDADRGHAAQACATCGEFYRHWNIV